jgi:hypothetical protein
MWQQRPSGRPVEAADLDPVGCDREAIAHIDSQLVDARWRWLHAVWEEDVDRLQQARIAIDLLLERRFEIRQAAAA